MNKLFLFFLLALTVTSFSQAQTTLTLQPTATEGKDAMIEKDQGNPGDETTNFGTSSIIYVLTITSSTDTIFRRSLLEFDLSTVPQGAYIESATLYLYGKPAGNGHYQDGGAGSNAAWIERVTEEWGEMTVTWANQPGVTPASRVAIPAESSTYANHELDVTTLYQDIINQPDSGRHGIRIKLQQELEYNRLLYRSSDDSGDTTEVPKLVLTYRDPICGHWMGDCGATSLAHRGGGVAIGTSVLPDGYKLAVNGNMICEEVLVEYYERWPDWVFSDDFELMPIDELEQFIKTNKHLPGIPSQQQIQEQGFHSGEMDALLLEQIEKLTLYTIENQRQIDELAKKLERLEKSQE